MRLLGVVVKINGEIYISPITLIGKSKRSTGEGDGGGGGGGGIVVTGGSDFGPELVLEVMVVIVILRVIFMSVVMLVDVLEAWQ